MDVIVPPSVAGGNAWHTDRDELVLP